MVSKSYLVYVVYGNDPTYYLGTRFGILSFLSQWQGDASTRPEVVVLAEQTHYFDGMPIKVFGISSQQKLEWSLNNQYHFRIKNRGIRFLADALPLGVEDKLVFLDADTYFTQSTNIYFDTITAKCSLMYFPEVNINSLPDSNEYGQIKGRAFNLKSGETYTVTPESTMWASAVIGVTGKQVESLDYADDIMLALRDAGCHAHTLEQFALSEALRQQTELIPAKPWLNHYSTSGRKDWGRKVLERFFTCHGDKPFEEQIKLAQSVSFTRPLTEVIRGHIYKKKKKIRKLLGLKEE